MLTNRRLYTNKPARTLIVDSVNGPFTTLAAAKASRQKGEIVVVRPGNYTLGEKLFYGSTLAVGSAARSNNYLTFTTYTFNGEEFVATAHGLQAGDVFRFSGLRGVGTVPVQDYHGPDLIVESVPTSSTVRVVNFGPDETIFSGVADGTAVLCLPEVWYFEQGAVVTTTIANAVSAAQVESPLLTFAAWGVVRGHGIFESPQYAIVAGDTSIGTHIDIECDALRSTNSGGVSPSYTAAMSVAGSAMGDTMRIKCRRIESEVYDAIMGVSGTNAYHDIEADVIVSGNNLLEVGSGSGSEIHVRAGLMWSRDNIGSGTTGGINTSQDTGAGKIYVTADKLLAKNSAINAASAHTGADTYYIDIAEVISQSAPTVSITANIPNTAIILSPRTRLVSEYDNAAGSAVHVTGTNKLTLSAGTMLRPHANATNCVSGTGTIISEGAKATKSKAAGVTVTGTAIDVNSAYL